MKQVQLMRDYLNKNASEDMYATYFASDKYKAPSTEKKKIDNSKGLFIAR
jgi:hypothetical protein